MPIDTKELMKQVSRIRVITNRMVDEHLSGAYHSAFKGQGMEFDEVREYTAGDDIRSIDWNVTARMGHPFIKRFSEERELTVIFLVDISGSQCFGSEGLSKADVSAAFTGLLALSAIKNQDKVGLILFTDRIEKCLPPRKGRTAALRLVRDVLATEETRRKTDLAGALRFLNNVQKRKAVVFLISDFVAPDFYRELRVTARKHDVICCPVFDRREMELPDVGLLEIQDPETGDLMLLDTGSAAIRQEFREKARAEKEQIERIFKRLKMDTIELSTEQPDQLFQRLKDAVRKLLNRRSARARHG